MKFLINLWACAFLLSGCSSSNKELHIYSWGDFIKPEAIEQFEREQNCKVVIDTFDSNEAMYAKLKAGASGYDLIFPTGYILATMNEQNMIHPLQKNLIPNLINLDQSYLDLLREEKYANAVPYAISFSGIAYRQDRLTALPASWGVFSNKKLRGRMTMLNDIREALGAALKYHHFSLNTVNESEIQIAADQLIAWKRNLAKLESEQYKNGIASAEYLVVQGYSGDIMQIMQEDKGVGFLLPKEGSIFSCDYVAIPHDAQNVALAHAFINFLQEPEIAAANMQFTFSRIPNKAAYPLLPSALQDSPVLFPPADFIEKSEVIKNLGDKILLYNKAWDYIKAAY